MGEEEGKTELLALIKCVEQLGSEAAELQLHKTRLEEEILAKNSYTLGLLRQVNTMHTENAEKNERLLASLAKNRRLEAELVQLKLKLKKCESRESRPRCRDENSGGQSFSSGLLMEASPRDISNQDAGEPPGKEPPSSVLVRFHSTLRERVFYHSPARRMQRSEWCNLRENHSLVKEENNRLVVELSSKIARIRTLEAAVLDLKEQNATLEACIGEQFRRKEAEMSECLSELVCLRQKQQGLDNQICTLQTQNQHLGEEVSAFARQERHFVIGMRFMRAHAFHLVRKIEGLKEEARSTSKQTNELEKAVVLKEREIVRLEGEKEEAKGRLERETRASKELESRLGEANEEASRLREEKDRQKDRLFDMAEEKREAIRQLCFVLNLLQERNKYLEVALSNVRSHSQKS